ncbi:MAG TPA: VOC family protein [Candidatus Acidoferrum sp.]|nr:VOC family protein [Candidatus Acidoferrum sp.]
MSSPILSGPDFIAFVVDDVAAAGAFWRDVVGLEPATHSPPQALVFNTSPIPVAVRAPRPDEPHASGQGIAVWFSVSGDVDEYRAALVRRGADVGEPQNGPFGRMFTLVAPGGFVVTVHAGAP